MADPGGRFDRIAKILHRKIDAETGLALISIEVDQNMAAESTKAIYAAIAANFAIAVMKFTAAGFTGSSAMLSEGIHSLVDTGNDGLLLLAIRMSKKPLNFRKDLSASGLE